MISAVILAAGMSLRMGRCKLLEKLAGVTLMEHAVEAFARSDVAEVVVVLGDNAAEVSRAASGVNNPKVRTVVNERFRQGLSSSIRLGVSAVDPRSEAAFIGLADMPLVSSSIINRLIQEYHATHAPIVLPTYHDAKGHPVLFDRSLFPALETLEGDEGARSVVSSQGKAVKLVEVDTPTVLFDIDTPKDLAEAQAFLEKA